MPSSSHRNTYIEHRLYTSYRLAFLSHYLDPDTRPYCDFLTAVFAEALDMGDRELFDILYHESSTSAEFQDLEMKSRGFSVSKRLENASAALGDAGMELEGKGRGLGGRRFKEWAWEVGRVARRWERWERGQVLEVE